MMDIVDSQIHVGPGGIEETLAAMDAVGVKSALIDEFWIGQGMMPSYQIAGGMLRSTYPTAELASLTHPERFSYLMRVDRRDPEMKSTIRLEAAKPHVRAMRVAPGMTVGELKAFAEGDYDEMFAAALDSGLSVVFVAILGQPQSMKHVAEKFPAMKFVMDHCAMPIPPASRGDYANFGVSQPLPPMSDTSDDKGKAAEFERILKVADAHANVGLKWAHAQRMFEVSGYPFKGLRPYMKSALNRFGAERMMWASDVSANRTGESWAELLFWIRDNPDITDTERANLLGGTARKWMNWPASA
jgi:predicted TIM-barrel fold metal-dependent hydrolase